jgi:anti-sigma regulatory factor (Ser/Thr protein kinase)
LTKRIQPRGENVRRYILENVGKNPNISTLAAKRFGISRQAIHAHLQNLLQEGALTPKKEGERIREYQLAPLVHWKEQYEIKPGVAEDVVWMQDVTKVLGQQPQNIQEIWHFCFTEMFNNAIDHSEGRVIGVEIVKTAIDTQMMVSDNGIGIFKKIQGALNLLDERHAVLELSKGKLTTDPASHTGQGIFFTSRVLDSFDVLSGMVYLSHVYGEAEDWIFERDSKRAIDGGTAVLMKLHNHTSKTFKQIADKYSGGDNYGFVKTVVPVRLAQYGNDLLISRSQAKRLLARVEKFETVIFDFSGVPSIGQAFADEIFRVFQKMHPEIKLVHARANTEVKRMVHAALADARDEGLGQNTLFRS